MTNGKLWAIGLVATALATGCNKGRHGSAAEEPEAAVQVKVIHPRKGALERLCIQPGSVHSFESIQLFAEVAGFLQYQKVDIGDRVKKGEVLAIVDVPDLKAQVRRSGAAVDKANAELVQMQSHVEVAEANLEASLAAVKQAKATAKAAAAWVKYRSIQLERMRSLVQSKSIEDRLYDESLERYDASVQSEIAAVAAITTTEANVKASKSKIDQAKADVVAANADIEVAKAELEKAQVNLAFATIKAPFDGVITYRSMNPKDFVRAANSGANINPLLSIHRTDLFRVVVLVPDRDVEFIGVGKPAMMEIDSLPGRTFKATVSRIATSLDPQTRLMRVELDLPNNKKGQIYDGMYGQVTIVLEKQQDLLSIPTPCLASKAENGQASVYVVRSGRAEKVQVTLGLDTGLRVAALQGLSSDDQVILNPSSDLSTQPAVIPTEWDEAKSQ